jgi:phage antirepressor YoqD-like protein
MNFGYIDDQFARKDFYNMAELATLINISGMGRNNLLKYLREKGILNQYNEPTDSYKDLNYFKRRTNGYEPILVTPAGAKFITRLLK